MRFKPPPPNSSIGWRVEFRPCEVQITDFENAAIVCFTVLLTRVILSYKLNLLIPISKVDQNMIRAQKRDAVKVEKFWFRRDITSDVKSDDAQSEYTEFTINEIINGKVLISEKIHNKNILCYYIFSIFSIFNKYYIHIFNPLRTTRK